MKKYSKLRKQSYELAAEWLKGMVSEEEASSVTPEVVKGVEATQDSYVWVDESTTKGLAPYSSRWFYKRLKAAAKLGIEPDFTVSKGELG